MPRALISVSDKTGLVDFARGLADARFRARFDRRHGARRLQQAGLAVVGISDVTGFPEMMDGRVKTLHPLVHGGILARRGRPDDLDAGDDARHRPDRSRRRQPVSVREGRGESRHAVRRADRGDRHRRPEPGARGGQEFPGRARRRLAGRLRRGARAARSRRRPVARVPVRPCAQGVCAHRQLRHGDRVDARATVTADRRRDVRRARRSGPHGSRPDAPRC